MKNIIIVEDDPGMQDAFDLMFNASEYNVTILANGKAILENNFEIPDLFILDKQLSGIDGLGICRHLKNQDNTRAIPVIMLSASPGIGNLARQAGADDALEKPFKIKTLRDMLAKYLS